MLTFSVEHPVTRCALGTHAIFYWKIHIQMYFEYLCFVSGETASFVIGLWPYYQSQQYNMILWIITQLQKDSLRSYNWLLLTQILCYSQILPTMWLARNCTWQTPCEAWIYKWLTWRKTDYIFSWDEEVLWLLQDTEKDLDIQWSSPKRIKGLTGRKHALIKVKLLTCYQGI